MVLTAFEPVAEDVVAAAEMLGHALTIDEGQGVLDSLDRSELEAVAKAALDADDL